MKNLCSIIALVILSATISSCGGIKEKGFTHLPFQKSEGGRWGLIGTDGKVLFNDEFTEKPSNAINGIFVVKNENGLFDYYSALKQPKKVAGSYLQAGLFIEAVAPVVTKDSPVSFIKKDGSEAFAVAEYDGVQIVSVTNFSDGLAIIVNAQSKCGYINTKGEVVIKPIYLQTFPFKEGYALVYEPGLISSSSSKGSIIDKTGGKILDIDNTITGIHEAFSEGLIGFTDDPEMNAWGFMNAKGEKIIKPNDQFLSVKPFNGGYAAFSDGNGYGIIDKTGAVVLRSKYQDIQYANGKQFFAKENGKYVLIDSKGKTVNKDDYASVVNESLPEYFLSDFFNLGTELKRVIKSITTNSINDLSLDATSGELFDKFENLSKESLKGTNLMKDNVGTKNIQVERVVEFTTSLSAPKISTVTKKDMWGKSYEEDEVVGTNFAENAKVKSITFTITLLNKAAGNSNAMVEILKTMSAESGSNLSIEPQGENCVVIKLGN